MENPEEKDEAHQPKKKHHTKKALLISNSPSTVPLSDLPVVANFDSSHLTVGAGVAIFHLASSRVIICQHSVDKYWFLPKGRRDAGEDTASGAEREGFEEVRPLPLKMYLFELTRATDRLSQPSSPYTHFSSSTTALSSPFT